MVNVHRLSQVEAGKKAIRAERKRVSVPEAETQYSDISDDDSVLDMVNELDQYMENVKDSEMEPIDIESLMDETVELNDTLDNYSDDVNIGDEEINIQLEEENDGNQDAPLSILRTTYEVTTYTVTKQSRYIDNELASTVFSVEQDYFVFHK